MVDLKVIAAEASVCQRCSLAEKRNHVVFGEGDEDSPLMLIGEGPGENEDESGRPFVGRAGQLLDKALAEAGPGRKSIYIANTVKCRAADWHTGKPVNRPPSEVEISTCRHWLDLQIEAIKPLVILCVGAPSSKSLIKMDFKITQERGRFFESSIAKAIIATLHPSYVLRQANISGDGGYSLLVADIAKAWEMAVKLRERGICSPLARKAVAEELQSQLPLM